LFKEIAMGNKNNSPDPSDITGNLDDIFDVSEGSYTTPVMAHDVAGFIERSFHEALPFQYLREFVVNSEEAGASRVVIEPDWIFVESRVNQGLDPVYRLSVWDNGCGMDEDVLIRFRHMFSTTKGNMRGRHANYGMGAKISAMPCNPAGLIVMSWQNGEGNMIILHQNPHDGQYGMYLQEVETSDGSIRRVEVAPTPEEYDHFYDVDGKFKPRVNGTLIIFKGTSPTDNTYLGPTNFPWERTIRSNTRNLNTRFARLSRPGFEVYCYEVAHKEPTQNGKQQWANCRADASKAPDRSNKSWRYGQYRQAQGAFNYWDEAASHQGTVDIPDGKVHWWLFHKVTLTDARKKDAFRVGMGLTKLGNVKTDEGGLYDTFPRADDRHSYTPRPGSLAVLYKNELYDIRHGVGNHHLYNYFGIYDSEVRKRIVLVVEPHYTEDSGVWPNAVRSGLEYTGMEKLPWDYWGLKFNAAMPKTLKKMIESGNGGFRESADFTKRVLDKVRAVGEKYGLFTGIRRRKTPVKNPIKKAKTPQTPQTPGPTKRIRRSRRKAVGHQGKAMPALKLISAAKIPDAPRPASYIPGEARRLDVFEGNALFQEAIQEWQDRYGHVPGSAEIVSDTVMEVYCTMLLARIIHVLSLEGQPHYTKDDVEKMVSAEALTTAIAGGQVDADILIQQKLSGKFSRGAKKAS